MALPSPDRNLPDTDDTGPPGPSGGDYADEVAAEVERIWDLVPNVLANIGGSANAITAECDPPLIKAYSHGQQFWLVPGANNSGPVTIDIDSRGPVDLVAYDGQALQEDDLISGEGTALVYDGDNGQMRLTHPTARELLSRASGGATVWEQIGDSGEISGAVANVEFTFTAGRYSHVIVVASDIDASANQSQAMSLSLRHAGGAIVTLTTATTGAANQRAQFTARADLEIALAAVGLNAGSGLYIGRGSGGGNAVADYFTVTAGQSATAPDRVRVSMSTNIAAGRVTAYGLRTEAD